MLIRKYENGLKELRYLKTFVHIEIFRGAPLSSPFQLSGMEAPFKGLYLLKKSLTQALLNIESYSNANF